MSEEVKSTEQRNRRFWAGVLLSISVLCYMLGILLPAFRVRKLLIFNNDVTILGSVWMLFGRDEFFLASIILIFSILLPLTKYCLLSLQTFGWGKGLNQRLSTVARVLSRHAMLDVYVIALFILTFKMGRGIITAQVRSGTIFFSISVLTSLIASSLTNRLPAEPKSRKVDIEAMNDEDPSKTLS